MLDKSLSSVQEDRSIDIQYTHGSLNDTLIKILANVAPVDHDREQAASWGQKRSSESPLLVIGLESGECRQSGI